MRLLFLLFVIFFVVSAGAGINDDLHSDKIIIMINDDRRENAETLEVPFEVTLVYDESTPYEDERLIQSFSGTESKVFEFTAPSKKEIDTYCLLLPRTIKFYGYSIETGESILLGIGSYSYIDEVDYSKLYRAHTIFIFPVTYEDHQKNLCDFDWGEQCDEEKQIYEIHVIKGESKIMWENHIDIAQVRSTPSSTMNLDNCDDFVTYRQPKIQTTISY